MIRILFTLFLGCLSFLSTDLFAQCYTGNSIGGSGSVCGGSKTVTIAVAPNTESGSYYQLYRDGLYVSGQNGGGVITWNVNRAGTYTVRGGCSNPKGEAVVTENSTMKPAISVSGSGCTTTLSGSGGVSYQWRKDGPTGTLLSEGSSFTPGYGGTFFLVAKNECGTSNYTSETISGLPTLNITTSGAPIGTCPGIVTLYANGGSDYVWTTPNGSTVSGSSISAQQAGTYTLRGKNSCGASQSDTQSVTFDTTSPVKPVFSSGPTNVCQGTATSAYSFTTSSGTIKYYISGAGSSTISANGIVTWSPTFKGTATISATASTCTTSSSTSKLVYVKALSDINLYEISGGGSTCGGSKAVTLRQWSSQLGVDYTLRLNGSGISSKAGTGSMLTWEETSVGTYTIVASTGACTKVMDGSATITDLSSFTTSISKSDSGCNTLLTASGGTSYVWRQDGKVVGEGATFRPERGGHFQVTATNDCRNTATATASVDDVPEFLINASGPTYNACVNSLTLSVSGGMTGGSYTWTRPDGSTAGGPSIEVGRMSGTYTLSGPNSCGKVLTATQPVSVVERSTNPFVQNTKISYKTFVKLTAGGAATGESYMWYNASGTFLASGLTYTTPVLTGTTTYYVTKFRQDGTKCESFKVPLTVTVNRLPLVNAGPDKTLVLPQEEVVLTGSASDPDGDPLTLKWIKVSGPEGVVLAGDHTATLTLTGLKEGNYVFRLSATDQWDAASDEAILRFTYPPNNYNYIRESVVLVPGKVSVEEVGPLSVQEKSVTTTYFDGLGRPMQQVSWQGSPQKFDVVQPVVYDVHGRESKKYLPFVPAASDGWYKPNEQIIDASTSAYIGIAQNFYAAGSNNKIADDPTPYAQTIFEASPLSRVLEQGAPGAAWQPDQDAGTINRTIKKAFRSNTQTGDAVIQWQYRFSNIDAFGSLSSATYYANDQLSVSETRDEHDQLVTQFMNKKGQVVLKEIQGAAGAKLRTYYVYDDMGQLRAVLPPKFSDVYQAAANAIEPENTDFSELCFWYHYDARGRMTEKYVPGGGATFMVYDRWNRLVLTQDAKQREENVGKWLYTKYDQLNRAVISGEWTDNNSPARSHQELKTAVMASSGRFESRNTAQVHGYSLDATFPAVVNENLVFTVTFYDDYAFKFFVENTAKFEFRPKTGFEQQPFNRLKNQITGSKVKILGASGYLHTVNYYDKYYRLLQSITENIQAGTDRITNAYDFSGKLVSGLQEHQGLEQLATLKEYKYDHAGRLTQTWQHIETQTDPLYYLKWTDQAGVSISGNTITKTAATSAYDAGAASLDRLEAGEDGWMEVSITGTDRVLYGFADVNVDANYTSIDYAVYTNPHGTLHAYENGVHKANLGTYQAGDKIRISRERGVIKFYKNGSPVYTSARSSATTLMADVSLFYNGNKISDIKASFANRILLAQNHYNELGELVEKNLHQEPLSVIAHKTLKNTVGSGTNLQVTAGESITLSPNFHAVAGSAFSATIEKESFLQSVDYRYNIRGWLTHINNADLSNDGNNNDDANDVFGFELKYNTGIETGVTPWFNGNIAEAEWNGSHQKERQAYGYEYDPLNRLTKATYRNFTNTQKDEESRYSVPEIKYDLNGNIDRLQRRGMVSGKGFGLMDNLTYHYKGNQLMAVNDAVATREFSAGDFFDNNPTEGSVDSPEYEYYANGSLKLDKNQGIISIKYNQLNLPEEVVISETKKVNYIYDAAGIKLRKIVTDGAPITSDYIAGIHYQGGKLEFIQHQEGRILKEGTGFKYEYNISDHLGNVRVSFHMDPDTKKAGVIQENHFYPYGLKQAGNGLDGDNKYLFNGKELQTDQNWYDYGARMYDPAIGRWHVVDPLAEKFHSWAPYTFVLDNPLVYKDPDGRDVIITHVKGSFSADPYASNERGKGHMNAKSAAAFAAFVSTDEGRKLIGQYARAGDVIGGVKFEKDGIYSDQVLTFQEFDVEGAYYGRTTIGLSKDKSKMSALIELNTAYLDNEGEGVEGAALNINHEMVMHLSKYDSGFIEALKSGDFQKLKAIYNEYRQSGKVNGGVEHQEYLNDDPQAKKRNDLFEKIYQQLKKELDPKRMEKAKKNHDERL